MDGNKSNRYRSGTKIRSIQNLAEDNAMSKRYRVGIVGCGRIDTVHANVYQTIDATQIVVAMDPDPERRLRFDEVYHVVNLYENYREMLANEALDIVSICTWPRLSLRNGSRRCEQRCESSPLRKANGTEFKRCR